MSPDLFTILLIAAAVTGWVPRLHTAVVKLYTTILNAAHPTPPSA